MAAVPISETRRAARGLAALLGSAALGALGLAMIASGQWDVLDARSTTLFLLIIQWQLFGVLICKLGIDQVLFASVSRAPDVPVGIWQVLSTRVLPLSAIYSLIVAQVFSWDIALPFCLSILLDSASVYASAVLNGKRKHAVAAIGTIFNYPLFFLLLWIASAVVPLSEASAIILFCLSSLGRCLWLVAHTKELFRRRSPQLASSGQMAIQPLLNHVMFRGDQLLLPFLLQFAPLAALSHFGSSYVFLAKFPELAGGAFVHLGLVLFPRLNLVHASLSSAWVRLLKTYWPWILLGLISIALLSIGYRALYANPAGLALSLTPFVCHAALVFPVNLVTFAAIQNGRISLLIQNLVISLAAGILWLLLVAAWNVWDLLPWVAPIQLAIFLLLCILRESR